MAPVVDYASNIWGHACGSAAMPVLNRVQKNRSTAATQPATNPEDDRRKMSLEKNRLAAAKCRVNKKEKTDQLQRDSHDKAVENTFLKQMIMQMKEEVLQLQTILTSHSSSDRCRNPEHHPRGPRCSRLRQPRNPDGEQPFPVERGYRISRAMLLCFVTFQCWFGVSRRKGKWQQTLSSGKID